MTDFCPIQGVDHVEFYVGNAHQAASYYEKCFGFTRVATRNLETGHRLPARSRRSAGAFASSPSKLR